VEVVFHAHHAVISDRLQERATRALSRLAQRFERAVSATVRFHQDGPTRRVEICVNSAGHAELVAHGASRYYGPALKVALAHLESQVARVRRAPKQKWSRLARA
jgi:ribosome-associated translation inhibitor RaiA